MEKRKKKGEVENTLCFAFLNNFLDNLFFENTVLEILFSAKKLIRCFKNKIGGENVFKRLFKLENGDWVYSDGKTLWIEILYDEDEIHLRKPLKKESEEIVGELTDCYWKIERGE